MNDKGKRESQSARPYVVRVRFDLKGVPLVRMACSTHVVAELSGAILKGEDLNQVISRLDGVLDKQECIDLAKLALKIRKVELQYKALPRSVEVELRSRPLREQPVEPPAAEGALLSTWTPGGEE